MLRQLTDCREEAKRRGWIVGDEYVDDDVSAYSGIPRPAYRQMLVDLREGRRDAVIVWHLDRLHRRPIELEEFVQTCGAAGVTDVVTLHGDFNLGSGDGLLVARLLSSVAANESDSKRRRGQRKSLEIAQSGRPHAGGPRVFGYQADKVTPEPREADIYRQLAERALAGESLNSLSAWLEQEGVRTVGGRPWRTQVVRQILINPRYWGVRVHQGRPLGPASWPGLVSPSRVSNWWPARRAGQILAIVKRKERTTGVAGLLGAILLFTAVGAIASVDEPPLLADIAEAAAFFRDADDWGYGVMPGGEWSAVERL